MKTIELLKPSTGFGYNNESQIVGSINKNSDYIPLFDLLPKMDITTNIAMTNKFNSYLKLHNDNIPFISLLNSANMSYYKRSLISDLNIQSSDIRMNIAGKKAIVDSWILTNSYKDRELNNIVKSGVITYGTNEWDVFFNKFKHGVYALAFSSLSNMSTMVSYGFICKRINYEIDEPLVQMVCKREHVPFIRANWMLNYPLPEKMVELWVLSDINKPSYPNQIFRKKIKENILSNSYYKDMIVLKSKEEMQSIWYKFKEPVFTSISDRKKWINEQVLRFMNMERKNLNVKFEEKKMFNFDSVKVN